MKAIHIALHLSLLCLIAMKGHPVSAAESANLDQIRNGSASSPLSPGNWVNGNAGASQAHYIEGMSIPYRCVMTGLTAGSTFTLIIGYDIRNGGKNAIDYLTHYDRLMPHNFATHSTQETIDPLIGTGVTGDLKHQYAIPLPASTGDALNQPVTSMNALPAGEKLMTLFNGTIDTIYYVSHGSLSASTSETVMAIQITTSSATCVLAWGGHIASRSDWGFDSGGNPNSAGGISGSPFHMRLKSWSYGSTGSQDRSLSGNAVLGPPVTLPVELLSFSAHTEKEHCILTWSTASEKNSDYFIIEKSRDGAVFNYAGTVKAAGTSHSLLTYRFVDYNPLTTTTYYHLVEMDINGNRADLGTVFVNPKTTKVTKELIYNVQGDLVMLNYSLSEDYQNLGLPDGIYIAHCFAGNAIIVRKILVKKQGH